MREHERRKIRLVEKAAETLDQIGRGDILPQIRTPYVRLGDALDMPPGLEADIHLNVWELKLILGEMVETMEAELHDMEVEEMGAFLTASTPTPTGEEADDG